MLDAAFAWIHRWNVVNGSIKKVKVLAAAEERRNRCDPNTKGETPARLNNNNLRILHLDIIFSCVLAWLACKSNTWIMYHAAVLALLQSRFLPAVYLSSVLQYPYSICLNSCGWKPQLVQMAVDVNAQRKHQKTRNRGCSINIKCRSMN